MTPHPRKKTNRTTLPPPFPVPFGAHVRSKGVDFTLFSRHATRVWLMLFKKQDAAKPDMELALSADEHRIGDIWHVHVPEAKAGMFYLYRMDGTPPEGVDNVYHPHQWLLDPYARAIAGAPEWGDPFGIQSGRFPKSGSSFPKCVIVNDDFDWGHDPRPRIPLEDSIIYEAHLRGYTAHENANVRHPGTYRGFIEKIPYIKSLGVTSVELLPIQEFNEMEYYHENDARRKLRNFWGYSTMAFFAPNSRYAADGVHGQQVREFKELVRALHAEGIEVILDIVFNHTNEGGTGGPVYAFRGIDPAIYYMMEQDGKNYRNYSGCGNTVNCNHPVVRQFILHCLRYWVTEFHVDGFRFDLASVLTRAENGDVLDRPPVVEMIAEDPLLRGVKLIAEAWDAAGLYQVGSFPSARWSEWNGKYRDDVRQFWRGGPGLLSAFATRIAGSGDLYDRPGQRPQKSINFITSHDGFTMADIVSYNQKHNSANCENNRDGDNHNHSFNHGVEGPTDDPAIRALRKRKVKNFIATLMLSQGVPMLLAGDEFYRTQKGNNNAYCQDNELSWLDWKLIEQHRDLFTFTQDAIAFRKAHPSLRRRTFLRGCRPETGGCDIVWLAPGGGDPNWDNDEALGCLLNGMKEYTGADEDKDHVLLLFNGSARAVEFKLPDPPGALWEVALTTEEKTPQCKHGCATLKMDAFSVTALTSACQD